MPGAKLSTRDYTTSKTGGVIPINMPNGGGWTTKLITEANLLAGVGDQPMKLPNQTGSFTAIIPANSLITCYYFTIQSGSPQVQIGTTLNGIEILEPTPMTEDLPVQTIKRCAAQTTIYFYVSGGNVNLRIDYKTDFI